MENIKISKLEIENVKRVKAVKIEPTRSGLTVIGGNNEQGKTSVLDAIAWALGGNKFKPAEHQRVGSVVPPAIDITLSNGLRVERRGKNSDLKVTDPAGEKAGQMLLVIPGKKIIFPAYFGVHLHSVVHGRGFTVGRTDTVHHQLQA